MKLDTINEAIKQTILKDMEQFGKLSPKLLAFKSAIKTITKEERDYYMNHYASPTLKKYGKMWSEMSNEEHAKASAEDYNLEQGDLEFFDCEKCKNKGLVAFAYVNMYTGKWEWSKERCKCDTLRNSLYNFYGTMGQMVANYKIDKYTIKNDWQKQVKNTAEKFIKNHDKWFTMLGQSGSGKSHICTAICENLARKGYTVEYMPWIDKVTYLKNALIENYAEYDYLIEKLKNVDVLYIDDLFKNDTDTKPTPTDIKIAYTIINERYLRAKSGKTSITIINCEKTFKELLSYDEAIVGRIYEMSKGYLLQIFGIDKNYRLGD